MKKSVLLAVKLFVICAVATLVLAFTNQKTAPVIEERAKKEEQDALKEVYPEAQEIKPLEDSSKLSDNITAINVASVNGEQAGYIFSVSSPSGYDGPVNFVIGAKNDGTVTGFKVLSQTETVGFGARVAEPEYAQGMQGVKLDKPVEAEGNGGGPDKIPAMTGATLTTTAVKKAVNMVVEKLGELTGNKADTTAKTSEVTEDQLKAVYPGASSMKAMEKSDLLNETVRGIYETGEGFVFHVTSPQGFHGPIEFLVGVGKDGSIKGYKTLASKETEGYGAKVVEESYAKGLENQPLSAAPVDISGATFTTDAMKEAFQAVQAAFEKLK